MKYFDAHAHVQFPPYDPDREEILGAMEAAGVGAVMVGVDRASSEAAISLVEGRDTFFASVGLHPNRATDEFDVEEWKRLAEAPKVVAIGECGLDYFRPEDAASAKKAQKELFEKHISIATSLQKPLIIHARPSKGTMDAYRDLIDMLRSAKQEYGDRLTGDIHFFVGGIEEARDLIALDFTLSFTAVITFARDYDDVIRFVPDTHLLSETDAPYVAPVSRRGTRNDPLAVQDVVEALAQIRGENPETTRLGVLQNAQRLFGLG